MKLLVRYGKNQKNTKQILVQRQSQGQVSLAIESRDRHYVT